MPKILEGFKNFILRGNAVDLAVGVVIGAAFNGVVQSIVKSFLTPLITFKVNQFNFIDILNNLISFLLVAAAVYFFVLLPMNALLEKTKKPSSPKTKQCPQCKSEIPVDATRCAHCTQLIE